MNKTQEILLVGQLVKTALVLSIFYYSVKATSLMPSWFMLAVDARLVVKNITP